ncbi:MAG: 30S ribosomal protein S20 [Bacteroidales bacterium]|nr:30S ribosomal protein S20 [Bacteroidales bacterium]
MANHKSSLKRIKANDAKRIRNRYYARTMRNAIKKLRATTEKKEAETFFGTVISIIDKNAKRNIIHKNKASNLKSKLMIHFNKLA